jgi:O-antigen/teichoic acid export membrane protein
MPTAYTPSRMRSNSLAASASARRGAVVLTEGESSFRNAKLTQAALVAYKAMADAAGKGSIFLITIVAARRLSRPAFGALGLGTTLGWMLAVVSDFGVQMHLARSVARSPHDATTLLRSWWRFRVTTTAIGFAALVAVLVVLRVDAGLALPIALFAAIAAANGLVDLLNYFYRGVSRTDVESTLTIAQRASTLALGLAALAWRADVNLLGVAMLAPSVAALAWSFARARRIGHEMATDTPATAALLDQRFFRDVFPIGIGLVLSAIYFRIDVLLVQLWVGLEAVASYNAVFRLIDALRLFPAAVLAVVLPTLCRADDLRPLARVAAAVTAFGVVVCAALWLGADRIVLAVFGPAYAGAASAFRILSLSFPLLCLNFALTHQLVAWERQRAYALVCAAALAVNVGLNTWLIPAFSIDGAAWATLGTELSVTTGCCLALAGEA